MKKETPLAALKKVDKLPKVETGFGGDSLSLGFSHRYALEIALDVLSELQEDEKKTSARGHLYDF